MKKPGIGIVGCGNICEIYLQNLTACKTVEVVAVADLDLDRAISQAEKYEIPLALETESLMERGDVDLVLNITPPLAHEQVTRAALEAGKHVYTEKPLAISRESGQALVTLAQERGLRLGGAPDTFLGAGLQTCRALIDEGAIGEPLGATAFMNSPGVEGWHPSPEFFYQRGGGPMFDMGPYYLTALTHLLGPVRCVSGATRISRPERTIGSQPLRGRKIKVEVPTYVTGLLEYESGPIGTIQTTFDVWASRLPLIEVYGTEGTLSVPDPNTFGGPVELFEASKGEWRTVPLTRPYAENSRGVGLVEMLTALREQRPHRASGELTLHVLDIMQSIHEAHAQQKKIKLTTACLRPEPLPEKHQDWQF